MAQREIELILIRRLADYLATPIFVVDPRGDLIFYNEPAEKLLGRRFEESAGMTFDEWSTVFDPRRADGTVVPPDGLPLARALREHLPAHDSLGIVGLDEKTHFIEVTAMPLEGQGGRHLGAVAIFWTVDGK
jgi:PAS domain-containing protein